jgi:hypothetical protein
VLDASNAKTDLCIRYTMARMGSFSFGACALLLLLASLSTVQAGTSDHRYKPDEHVELWVNKVRITSIVGCLDFRGGQFRRRYVHFT